MHSILGNVTGTRNEKSTATHRVFDLDNGYQIIVEDCRYGGEIVTHVLCGGKEWNSCFGAAALPEFAKPWLEIVDRHLILRPKFISKDI